MVRRYGVTDHSVRGKWWNPNDLALALLRAKVWHRDFWGRDRLDDDESHKSWRPVTTLSYMASHAMAEADEDRKWWFRVTDRVLHVATSVAAVPAAGYSLGVGRGGRPYVTALLAGCFFAAHPIHAEAVANTTGRAEVLCALFYLVGFGLYGWSTTGPRCGSGSASAVASVAVLGCTWLSMLSKEHGITLPAICLAWDAYVGTATSIPELLSWVTAARGSSVAEPGLGEHQKQRRSLQLRLFVFRVGFVLFGAGGLAFWRMGKNGGSTPDFVCEQNPVACEKDPLKRLLSFSWLWCFNVRLLAWPDILCADWSGPDAIPLVESANDPRFFIIVLLHATIGGFLYSLGSTAAAL